MSRSIILQHHFLDGEIFNSAFFCSGKAFLFEQHACHTAQAGVCRIPVPAKSYVCTDSDSSPECQYFSSETLYAMGADESEAEVLTILSETPLLISCHRYILTSPNNIMEEYDFYDDLLAHKSKDGWIIDGYIGDEDEILIPATLHGDPVYRVILDDLSLNETHTALIISEGIQELSISFDDGRHLSQIVIPQSAIFITPPTHIQYTDWYKLQPSSPIYIGGYYCGTPGGGSGCETLFIPDGTIGIVSGSDFTAYWHRIDIPDSVLYIGDYAFARCACLNELRLPAFMNYLGEGAFQQCPRLSTARIPDGLTSPVESFQLCTGLCEVSMPEACWQEADHYFANCPRIVLRQCGGDRIILRDTRPDPICGTVKAFPDQGSFCAAGRMYHDIHYLNRKLLVDSKEYRDCYGNRVLHLREKDPCLRAPNGGAYWQDFWYTTGPLGVTQISHEPYSDTYLIWDGIPLSEVPTQLKSYVSHLYAQVQD